MRWIEINTGTKVYVNIDESSVANKVKNRGKIYKSDLNEYELKIADNLVIKSILLRRRDKKDVYFVRNENKKDCYWFAVIYC